MRAVVITGPGGIDGVQVQDVDKPSPGPGEVVVRIASAALNHLDLWVTRGLPGIPYPHIQGADGAGVVEELGEGVRGVVAGDKVSINPGLSCGTCDFCLEGEQSLCPRFAILGERLDGTFAEYVKVPAANVRPLPAHLGFDEGAALSLAHLTAWRMLVTKARIKAGETMLIHGIGGGVSCAALQIGSAVGMRCIVTSGSKDKLARASELGADATIHYETQNVGKEVRSITGKTGVDVAVDSVGAATWQASLQSLKRGGRLVTCGATTGPNPQTDILRIFWNQLTVFGSTMCNQREYRDMLAFVTAHGIRPVVDRKFPLNEAAEALTRMEDKAQFGKIVLEVAALL